LEGGKQQHPLHEEGESFEVGVTQSLLLTEKTRCEYTFLLKSCLGFKERDRGKPGRVQKDTFLIREKNGKKVKARKALGLGRRKKAGARLRKRGQRAIGCVAQLHVFGGKWITITCNVLFKEETTPGKIPS